MLWRLRGVLRGYVALPGLRFAPSGLRARCGVCLAFSGLHDSPDSASLPPDYGHAVESAWLSPGYMTPRTPLRSLRATARWGVCLALAGLYDAPDSACSLRAT